MKNKIFKIIACLLVAAMLTTGWVFPASADNNAADPAVTDAPAAEETTGTDPADTEAEVTDPETKVTDPEAEVTETEAQTTDPEVDVTDPEGTDESADSDTDSDTDSEDDSEEEEEEEEETVEYLTDEQALARCYEVAENDNFILYLDEEYERIGIYVKETGFVHWSNCVNAELEPTDASPVIKRRRMSNMAVSYGNATDLYTSDNLFSYTESTRETRLEERKTTYELIDNGVKITYHMDSASAIVPMYVVLEEDNVYVYIDTDEIIEEQGYEEGVDVEDAESDVIILTEIMMMPFMSAADYTESGYMFIPDGSGAIVKLNNGKGNYKGYSQTLYGSDITKVRELQEDAMEQAYLPVMAMVRGNNGLVMIASDGDTFATVNAQVSFNSDEETAYNHCWFSFTLRSNDTYNMAGESNIMIFERGDGKIPVDRIGVRFYPITSEEEEVPYTDIADVYRDYLIGQGLEKKTDADYAPLFIDFYGATLKSKSILGIPIDIKTAFTTFEEATAIVDELTELGVDQMVINYNGWSNDSMTGKIDTAKSVASCVGGKGKYLDMIEYFNELGIDFYGSIDSITFTKNGNGFWTLFDTAYRVSRSYARPYNYNLAYGTPEPGVAPALLAPNSLPDLKNKLEKNFAKYEGAGAGLGSLATSLWSDFSTRNAVNRSTTAEYIKEIYQAVRAVSGKIIADTPNAYLLPYVDTIKNVPLQSSQFKIVDLDIPFIQIVLHGYTPYSTEAINGSPESRELFLRAIAAGSSIQYDFIDSTATALAHTDYVDLYYATYSGWKEECVAEYTLANEILSQCSDAVITGYEVDGSVITTTYDNGFETVVDVETGVIKAGGKTYNYSDYVQEGGLG